MKRVELGHMPEGAHVTPQQQMLWIRDALQKITYASRRDDDTNALNVTRYYGSAAYDPPNLIAGAVSAIQTLALTGAALGMKVQASFSLDLQGIILNAWVSAADAVKYQFYNPTAGAIDLASGTVRVTVWKYTP